VLKTLKKNIATSILGDKCQQRVFFLAEFFYESVNKSSKPASFPSIFPAANDVAVFSHVLFQPKQEERWEQAINL